MGSLISWWSTAQATSKPGPQQVGKSDCGFSVGAAGSSASKKVYLVYEMYFDINRKRIGKKSRPLPSLTELIFQLKR